MDGARSELGPDDQVIVDLVPMVRKVVGSRIRDPHLVDDLVQETLVRVMAAHSRVEGDTMAPYAAVTARNVVASYARRNDRARARAHLLAHGDIDSSERPGDSLLRQEDRSIVAAALARLPAAERDILVAHEVNGDDTRTLAATRDTTPGAVAAQLARIRAKMRVEYLLVKENLEPPTDRCRAVLRALSAGDRRRQRELDTGAHLLECDCCALVSAGLLDRWSASSSDDEMRVPVARDADVVTARQTGRQVAARLGFSPTDSTLIATAISEIARNIVKFAERGEIVISHVSTGGSDGISIVARDVGPGIPALEQAMRDGYSTYRGLGLGLPGARRLMDEFDVVTEVGKGTTVSMTKWHSARRRPGDNEN
ncbi:MAG TPA: sigma-70 family RNA polymerase sigma factor [Nocardioidaceae bacterium]|nr:sigma-70 family RNA polymerase sigma factor [Nocardioidaceae bacterium]